mmetsp:Transcript_9224/g.37750  ORF Transcript_9224/g.37750 Transcript_9224/m.37750 type:complete len:268 (-) Transcript_9224:103-906(-)
MCHALVLAWAPRVQRALGLDEVQQGTFGQVVQRRPQVSLGVGVVHVRHAVQVKQPVHPLPVFRLAQVRGRPRRDGLREPTAHERVGEVLLGGQRHVQRLQVRDEVRGGVVVVEVLRGRNGPRRGVKCPHLHGQWQRARELHHLQCDLRSERVADERSREDAQVPEQRVHVLRGRHHAVRRRVKLGREGGARAVVSKVDQQELPVRRRACELSCKACEVAARAQHAVQHHRGWGRRAPDAVLRRFDIGATDDLVRKRGITRGRRKRRR